MKPSESKARDANYNTFNEAALLDDLEKLTSSIKSKVSKPLLSPLLSPMIASLLLIFFRHKIFKINLFDTMFLLTRSQMTWSERRAGYLRRRGIFAR